MNPEDSKAVRVWASTVCAECGQMMGTFPAPRECMGVTVCSGECAVDRRKRLTERFPWLA